MPSSYLYPSRFMIPGVPVHIVQRGHCREPVFFDEADYQAYLHWLSEAAAEHGCAIHAYVLMTNHIHILATPTDKQGVGRMMQSVGRHYVPYINHTYGTSGSIWEGRYKANLVQEDDYLLQCMRYIELNPVRVNMVRSPSQYRWSSYRCNGQGKGDPLVEAHPVYLSLGRTAQVRIDAYKALFKSHVDKQSLDDIRAAWQTGTPLGSDCFREAIEKKLGARIGQTRRGRPSIPSKGGRPL